MRGKLEKERGDVKKKRNEGEEMVYKETNKRKKEEERGG
jgi:hypothetical protein